MSKNKKKRKPFKKRNRIMATIAENDPTRFRQRTVRPEKGRGRKDRPRQKNWSGDVPFYGLLFLSLCAIVISVWVIGIKHLTLYS